MVYRYRTRLTIGRSWVRSPSNPMLDGSGVKAMPGSIPTPNYGSLYKNKKNTGSQMGQTKKIYLKKRFIIQLLSKDYCKWSWNWYYFNETWLKHILLKSSETTFNAMILPIRFQCFINLALRKIRACYGTVLWKSKKMFETPKITNKVITFSLLSLLLEIS